MSPRRSPSAISSPPRCCRATAISRAASIREVRANYLASPLLVVAYALAGSMNIDLTTRAGRLRQGGQAGLSQGHLAERPRRSPNSSQARSSARCSRRATATCSTATPTGARSRCPRARPTPGTWARPMSQNPPYFEGMTIDAEAGRQTSTSARMLALFGDSITTDHISPAGSIKATSPAGHYLTSIRCGRRISTYGARRGNHEVMMRGTFANIRIRNEMMRRAIVEGGNTMHQPVGRAHVDLRRGDALPGGEACRWSSFARQGIRHRLVARLGGQGHQAARRARGRSPRASSASIARTWSAWACCRCVFEEGTSWQTLGLKGDETVDDPRPRRDLEAAPDAARRDQASPTARTSRVPLICRIDTLDELEYFRNGGILHYVLRQLAA